MEGRQDSNFWMASTHTFLSAEQIYAGRLHDDDDDDDIY